jgi:hypothetical protein
VAKKKRRREASSACGGKGVGPLCCWGLMVLGVPGHWAVSATTSVGSPAFVSQSGGRSRLRPAQRVSYPPDSCQVVALPNRAILLRRYSDPGLVDCPFNQRRGRGGDRAVAAIMAMPITAAGVAWERGPKHSRGVHAFLFYPTELAVGACDWQR